MCSTATCGDSHPTQLVCSVTQPWSDLKAHHDRLSGTHLHRRSPQNRGTGQAGREPKRSSGPAFHVKQSLHEII